MSNARLVHAVRLTLHSREQIARVLRGAYLARERGGRSGKTLFFCDLEDADAKDLPADAELIRFVQSGVMSMAARRPGEYDFLVRARQRDDALHSFPGESQQPGARKTLFRLLAGEGVPAFAAASLSPAALKGAFDAVLLTDAALSFPPDAPNIMLDALRSSGLPALRGGIVIPQRADEPLLARLERAGFSLLPPLPFARSAPGAASEPPAAIYMPDALLSPPPDASPDDPPLFLAPAGTLSDHVKAARLSLTRGPAWLALIPLAQAALLFFCALAGFAPLALAAILAPEALSVRSLRQLPCALVRLSLLPQSALLALNALLTRAFRGKKLLPSLSAGGGACVAFGGTLLFLSLRGANALPLLLLVGLLWLAAPLIVRSLSLPARERIPLSEDERAQLTGMAKSAFFALPPEDASPAALLAACAGSMLGALEPDEAARRAQGMLPRLAPASAFDHACLLAAAQFMSERMAQCDAALRELPGQLIALSRSAPLIGEGGSLSALLIIAREHLPTPAALSRLRSAGEEPAMDALFLSPGWEADACFLPVTHPHTFLLKAGEQKSDPLPREEETDRFLVLACAALHSPFGALLMRSGEIAPYAPLFSLSRP